MFKGILVEKDDSGYRAGLRELDEADLPAGNVVVRVYYSTLNYKDALAITGKSPVVRRFPMVPGIDLGGVVEESSHADSHQPLETLADALKLIPTWITHYNQVAPHSALAMSAPATFYQRSLTESQTKTP